jgi:hypothetical protein
MAKTKMKRRKSRRRKSGKIRKRKNVIRGGLPIKKAVAFLTALFGYIKDKHTEVLPEDIDTKSYDQSDQIKTLKYLEEATVNKLVKEAKENNVRLYNGAKWSEWNDKTYGELVNIDVKSMENIELVENDDKKPTEVVIDSTNPVYTRRGVMDGWF